MGTSRKRLIIEEIISKLKLINATTEELPNCPRNPYTFTSNVFGNVYDSLEYLDNINDFPSVYCYPISVETRRRISNAETYCTFLLEIRGYVYGENPILLASDLAQDIQYIIESIRYRPSSFSLNIVECRTESLATDEGLLEPYGMTEVRALITYLQDYNI